MERHTTDAPQPSGQRPEGANVRAEARKRLIREDASFRRLANKHQEYDKRLQALQTRKYLSEEEKIDEATLKKLKLAVKDQMEAILQESVNG